MKTAEKATKFDRFRHGARFIAESTFEVINSKS